MTFLTVHSAVGVWIFLMLPKPVSLLKLLFTLCDDGTGIQEEHNAASQLRW